MSCFRNRPCSNRGTDRKKGQMTRAELSTKGWDFGRRGHKLSNCIGFVAVQSPTVAGSPKSSRSRPTLDWNRRATTNARAFWLSRLSMARRFAMRWTRRTGHSDGSDRRSANGHGHSVRIPAIHVERNFNLAAAAQTSWEKKVDLIQAVKVGLRARIRHG